MKYEAPGLTPVNSFPRQSSAEFISISRGQTYTIRNLPIWPKDGASASPLPKLCRVETTVCLQSLQGVAVQASYTSNRYYTYSLDAVPNVISPLS